MFKNTCSILEQKYYLKLLIIFNKLRWNMKDCMQRRWILICIHILNKKYLTY